MDSHADIHSLKLSGLLCKPSIISHHISYLHYYYFLLVCTCSQNYVSTHRGSLLLDYRWFSACLSALSRGLCEILQPCVFLARPTHLHLVTITAIFTLPFGIVCVSSQIPGLLVLPHFPHSNTHVSLCIPFSDPSPTVPFF